MSAIDLKRCHHCVGPLSVVQLDEDEAFSARGAAILCLRCDGEPLEEQSLVVPAGWE